MRLTEKEFNFFKTQMTRAKQKTQTDFFLAVLKSKPIITIENLNETLIELKRHGNNLNQVARSLNDYGFIENNFDEIIRSCWRGYEKIINLEEVIQHSII